MYPQQQQQVQYLAGISYNQVDQSTFNGNLPTANDAIPQVQQTQWLAQPQAMQMFATAIGIFRLRLQERSTRSGLHTWAYNQISNSRFQNQIYQQWGNTLAVFLEFLSVVQAQNNPPQVAVQKAADTMFKCYLATCVAQQPQLMQLVANDQNMVNELGKYSQMYGAINQDLQAYRSGQMMSPQQQPQMGVMATGQIVSINQPSSGQLPAVGLSNVYGAPQQMQRAPMPLSSMAVGQSSLSTNQSLPIQIAGQGSTGMDYGVPVIEPVPVAQPAQPKVINPVETYGVSVAPVTQAIIQKPEVPIEELDRPVPLTAKDVILDPHYYVPAGAVIDEERAYDTIYSPGGVITRPAYQVPDWKVTRNDTFVYTQMIDPTKFIRFYTRWPDGVVQEKIVEITEMMDYLKHEIDADLRRGAERSVGEVRVTALKISNVITDMKDLAEVKELKLTDENVPVRLSVELQGTTDMENEVEVRRYLRQELGLTKEDKLPSYEYKTTRTHFLDIDQDGFDALLATLDSNDLQDVAKDIAKLNRQGILEPRVFNFINRRLTDEVNAFLRDSMSQEIDIDDFVNDISELLDYLGNNSGTNYVKLLREAASSILGKAVQLSCIKDDDGVTNFSINDTYINLQTGWLLADLTDATINTEAQLVSNYTHAALIEAIKGMYSRADAGARILNRFRVITLDGAYLEIIRGVLVQSAFMFRRVA